MGVEQGDLGDVAPALAAPTPLGVETRFRADFAPRLRDALSRGLGFEDS